MFKGKGVELDSLREYVVGDDIKDIDWRSTARTGEVHTKLYAPLRDQKIVIIADTTPSMLLPTQSGSQKVEALFGLIVTLGMFVRKNRDQMALCVNQPNGKINVSRFSNTNNHIEGLLRSVDGAIHRTGPENSKPLKDLLQHTLHYLKHRAAIFIVSDGLTDATELKPLLTKLNARHQLFFMQIQPSAPFTNELDELADYFDIETVSGLVPELSLDEALEEEWNSMLTAWQQSLRQTCRSTGTAFGIVDQPEQTPQVLQSMFMEAKRYARRH